VLIGAVNLNLQYARLLSAGVRWMVMVLAVAMALDHLAIGGEIIRLAFGILFGGIVLALALAVGLGSKELVSRSLERETSRPKVNATEEAVRHL
jgi:ABC-type Na+ efflux pump permease subunit